ncbi:hypothetical protein SDRG_03287 [Saprolegnia diclina VS20]|uniref:Uncharacterized protein n=1 Tax=Saprolegnia diclina (strain VS20) TaxID=1156394 RepID=T0QLZ3_SAPDV|nr:hypothetical protein SDRG_03287 [Saprolegnia diclina VS20]EQC39079.1 hypothetical protein SDRG_03287 [Saprolegnia diclina VS20]|eukprot:XP_008607140.1 hypothetical protein SDRG_03287 [Saprolegnia diclina VS20]
MPAHNADNESAAVAVPVPLAVLVPSSSTTEEETDLSYIVDMELKHTKFLVSSWTHCNVVLTTQTLEVLENDKLHFACSTTHCTTRVLSALDAKRQFPLELLEHGKTKAVLNAPSASARDALLGRLDAAANGISWPSTSDAWTNFISVAHRINETKTTYASRLPKCNVSVALVQRHFRDMIDVYNVTGSFTTIDDVYSYFLDHERQYVADGAPTFAKTVHQLHPISYAEGAKPNEPVRPLSDLVTVCAHRSCQAPLPVHVSFEMHILQLPTVTCPTCSRPLFYETYKIAAFLDLYPSILAQFPTIINAGATAVLFDPPEMPENGRYESFYTAFLTTLTSCKNTAAQSQVLTALRRASKTLLQAPIGAYTIDLVQGMFRQLDFVNKMVPHTEYWMHPDVIEASIVRYEQFMYLMGKREADSLGHYPVLVPTSDIDLVWHAHQTTGRPYRDYSRSVNKAKCVIDHDDTIPGGDLATGYADTFVLWSQTFGEAYSSFPPSYEAWTSKVQDPISRLVLRKKWAKHGSVPAKDSRFFGVNEAYAVRAFPYATVVAEANAVRPESGVTEPIPIYVTVIGTPVMDGRVRMPYSRQTLLMFDGGLPFYYLPYVYNGGCAGSGYFGASGGCGATGDTSAAANGAVSGLGGCGGGGCGGGGCGGG